MTNKEAIFKLIAYKRWLERNFERFNAEPFDMAIGALEDREASVWECVKMREPTPQERESIKQYIDSISVTIPQPRTGHWITQYNVKHQKEYYYCSECREEFSYDGETGIKMNDYRFCPNCGAKMAVEK